MHAGERKVRVLYLEHNVDGTVGGSHYCLLEICRALDHARFEAVVWFYEGNVLEDEFRAAGAEVVVAPPLKSYNFARRARSVATRLPLAFAQRLANAHRTLVRRVRDWRVVLRERRVDLVHINNSCAYDQDLALAARLEGIPCIAHQRGMARHIGWFERRMALGMKRVIAISGAVRDNLASHGVRSQLLYDAIDPRRVSVTVTGDNLRRSLGIPADAPVIGIVGNVKRWKGQKTVLMAMRTIVGVQPDVHCVFVGAFSEPQYQQELLELASAERLAGRVHFLGYQRHPANWMALMDVVIHASIEPEPFGIVLLEAMALSKPVVATDCGGPVDIVEEGVTGYRVPPGDPAKLSVRVLELLSQRELRERMGIAGRARLENRFAISGQVRQIENLYREMLDGGLAAPGK